MSHICRISLKNILLINSLDHYHFTIREDHCGWHYCGVRSLPPIVAKGEPYLELLFELVGVAHPPVGVAAPESWLTGKRIDDKKLGYERLKGYIGKYYIFHEVW